MPIIDKLFYEIGYKTDKKSEKKALVNAKKLGLAVGAAYAAAAAGVAATFGLVKSFATLADQSVKTADKLGLTLNKLQELRYLADLNGISTTALDNSLQRMNRNIGDAARGTGTMVDVLKELRLDATELSKLDTHKQFLLITEASKALVKEGQELSVMMRIFGREGVDMIRIVNQGADAIGKYGKEFESLGGHINEDAARQAELFNDELGRISVVMSGVRNTIATALLPVFSDMVTSVKEFALANKDAIATNIKEFLTTMIPVVKTLWAVFMKWASIISTLYNWFISLLEVFNELLRFVKNFVIQPLIDDISRIGQAFNNVIESVKNFIGLWKSVKSSLKDNAITKYFEGLNSSFNVQPRASTATTNNNQKNINTEMNINLSGVASMAGGVLNPVTFASTLTRAVKNDFETLVK